VPVEMEFITVPPEAVIREIGGIDVVVVERTDGKILVLRVSQKHLIPSVIAAAVRNGGEIFRVTPRDYSLEEIYFAVQEQVECPP
jgi:hypothetical protein